MHCLKQSKQYINQIELTSPLVPIHTCSVSILKCSRTLLPYLFTIPDREEVGNGSCLCLIPGTTSSGFPFSMIFLCSLASLSASRGDAEGKTGIHIIERSDWKVDTILTTSVKPIIVNKYITHRRLLYKNRGSDFKSKADTKEPPLVQMRTRNATQFPVRWLPFKRLLVLC